MQTTATVRSATWLAALLVRWPAGADEETVAGVAADASAAGIELRLVGRPDDPRATRAGTVERSEVTAEFDRWNERGIGAGLVGAVGRLPGLPARVHRLPGSIDALRTVVAQQRRLRRDRAVPTVDLDPAWTLVLDEVDEVLQRVEESLLTVADGVFGTRGSVEEGGEGSDALVVAGGAFTDGAAGPVAATPTLLPGPTWTQLDLDARLTSAVRRTLDLRTGVLLRESPDPGGGPPLRVLRLASLARPGLALLWAEGPVSGLRAGAPLLLPDGASARRLADGRHLASTWSSSARIDAEAVDEVDEVDDRRTVRRRVRLRRSVARVDLDGRPTRHPAASRNATPEAATFEALVTEQREAWARRWAHADVEIDGDPRLQLAVRTGLYHLMASVPDHGEAAIGPRGLTGRAYRGHVFWDADVFVLPFLAATHPPAAAAMLAYRSARLPAAKETAASAGYAGARFPWESAHDGRDVTPTSVPGPDGADVEIATGRYQEHVTADVAWAAGHYLDWTGDRPFERGQGRALLFETARYWRSRVTTGSDGRGHLEAVMGPDEYHVPVDDDAYTNGMVRWNLRRAAALVGRTDAPELRREASAWARVADLLVDGYDPVTGRHEQFRGFSDLAPPPLPLGEHVPVAADLLLGHRQVAATQVIKQADVLMLHHLLPGLLPRGSLDRDLDRYLPLTAHGSSLSPGIHASLLARAGRPDEALGLLRTTAELDLLDLTGTAAAGVHLAAAGSLWQALVYGFLGLWPGPHGTVDLDPHLPRTWRSLTVRVTSRGRPLVIRATHDRVQVRCRHPIHVRLAGRARTVAPPLTELRLSDGRRDGAHTSLTGR